MSIAVESLEIEIKQKSDKASKGIEHIVVAMNDLRIATRHAVDSLGRFNSTLANTSSVANDVKSSMKGVSSAIKRNTSNFGDAKKKVVEYELALRRFNDFYTNFTFRDKDYLSTYSAPDYSEYRNKDYLSTYVAPNVDSNIIDADWREVESLREYESVIEDASGRIKDKITMDAVESADKIQVLKWQIEGIREELEKVLDGDPQNVGRIASLTKQYQKLREELEKAQKPAVTLWQTLKKVGSNLIPNNIKNFMSSFTRIAFYRAIRTLIKNITEGISIGVQNAYQFSKIMGGEFASTMDRLTSKNLQFKNQLGSMFSELIIMVTPFLENVLQKGISIANTLSQIFAMLNGDSTYKKAKYSATEWKEATDNAEKYKKQLLGIDEINNLTTNNSNSKGSSADYSSMFEYADVALNQNITDKITWIRDNLEEVEAFAIGIGTALLGWKIASAITEALAEGGIIDKLTALKQSIGITMIITGITFEAVGTYDIAKNGANLKNVMESIFGAGLTIGGGLLAWGTTSLLFTIPLVITVATISMYLGHQAKLKNNFEESELGRSTLKITSEFDKIMSDDVELRAKISNITTDLSDAQMASIEMAKKLIDEIFELDENDNKTSQQIADIKSKIKLLNDMNLDGVQLEFDDLTNKVVGSKDAIYQQIEALQQQWKLEALESAFKEAYQAEYEALTNLNKAKEEHQKLEDNLTIAKNEATEAEKNYTNAMQEMSEFSESDWRHSFSRNGEYIGENRDKYLELQNAVNEAKTAYEQAEYNVKAINKELEAQEGDLETLQETYDTAKGLVKDITNGYSELYTEVNSARGAMNTFATDMGGVNKTLAEQLQTVTELKDEYGKLDGLKISKGTDTEGNAITSITLEKYASGGFPEQGQLFIANEAGAEMVGSIGGQTAVANNQEITTAIATATYSAMTKALSENGGSINLTVEGDPQGMFKVMQKQANSYSKRTGRNAFA